MVHVSNETVRVCVEEGIVRKVKEGKAKEGNVHYTLYQGRRVRGQKIEEIERGNGRGVREGKGEIERGEIERGEIEMGEIERGEIERGEWSLSEGREWRESR